MNDSVAILQSERYNAESIAQKLASALNLLGIVLPRQARVIIKPNIVSQNSPRQCTGTHPAVVEALCMLLADSGNRITIGESSAFYQGGHTMRAFRTSGIERVAKKHGARLAAFEREKLTLKKKSDNCVLKEILLPSILEETDWIISAAKLKTHSFFEFSGAVKNLFGFVPGGAKFEYHYVGGHGRTLFAQKLADIWNCIQPNMSVIDAIWGLEGFGPASTGTPIHSSLFFAAENPWAADFIAARCAGFDPFKLDGIKAGIDRGYLQTPENISILGDFPVMPVIPYKRAPVADEKPKTTNCIYKLVAVELLIRERRCNSCGNCIPSCPLQAIDLSGFGNTAKIDQNRCLRCLHCVYICASNAIRIQGVSPFHMAGRALRRLLKI